MKKPFPPLDPQIVERLTELFPDKCPDFKDTDREVWIKSGQSSVVRFLKKQLADQQNTVLGIN